MKETHIENSFLLKLRLCGKVKEILISFTAV